MVEGFQLAHFGQVAVDGAPTPVELVKLGSFSGGGLRILKGMKIVDTLLR